MKLPGQVKNLCQFVTGGVDTDKESIKMCYMSMIRSAQRQIRIQTPYFIPDCSILEDVYKRQNILYWCEKVKRECGFLEMFFAAFLF